MDLTATILAAAGASPPSDRPLDGVNLLPILTGEEPPRERTLFWRVDRPGRKQKAVRHGHWKYLQDDMVEMLFDLEKDVSERQDVAYEHPETLAHLKKLLAEWEQELAQNPPPLVVK